MSLYKTHNDCVHVYTIGRDCGRHICVWNIPPEGTHERAQCQTHIEWFFVPTFPHCGGAYSLIKPYCICMYCLSNIRYDNVVCGCCLTNLEIGLSSYALFRGGEHNLSMFSVRIDFTKMLNPIRLNIRKIFTGKFCSWVKSSSLCNFVFFLINQNCNHLKVTANICLHQMSEQRWSNTHTQASTYFSPAQWMHRKT